jgi:hypothetical protein
MYNSSQGSYGILPISLFKNFFSNRTSTKSQQEQLPDSLSLDMIYLGLLFKNIRAFSNPNEFINFVSGWDRDSSPFTYSVLHTNNNSLKLAIFYLLAETQGIWGKTHNEYLFFIRLYKQFTNTHPDYKWALWGLYFHEHSTTLSPQLMRFLLLKFLIPSEEFIVENDHKSTMLSWNGSNSDRSDRKNELPKIWQRLFEYSLKWSNREPEKYFQELFQGFWEDLKNPEMDFPLSLSYQQWVNIEQVWAQFIMPILKKTQLFLNGDLTIFREEQSGKFLANSTNSMSLEALLSHIYQASLGLQRLIAIQYKLENKVSYRQTQLRLIRQGRGDYRRIAFVLREIELLKIELNKKIQANCVLSSSSI